jgi:hypothetical protein
MPSMTAEHAAEVRVRRHSDVPECDVVVALRGNEMSLRCRDCSQAVKWARIECKPTRLQAGSLWSGDQPHLSSSGCTKGRA